MITIVDPKKEYDQKHWTRDTKSDSALILPYREGLYILNNGDVIHQDEIDFYGTEGLGPYWRGGDEDEDKTLDARYYEQIGQITPSEWTEFAVQLPIDGKPLPFSFKGRPYLRQIYDISSTRVLLVFGRQCEKCLDATAAVLLENGSTKQAGMVEVGDRVVTYDEATNTTTVSSVIWVSDKVARPSYRIKTRLNHELILGEEHPIRQLGRWTSAKDLKVGDRIASIIHGGLFTGKERPPQDLIVITALLIGDGSIKNRALVGLPGPAIHSYIESAHRLGWEVHINTKKGTEALDCRITHDNGQLREFLGEELFHSKSATKFIPSWVFDLSKEDTALFINRLWATDGCCKFYGHRPEFTYCSISQTLVLQLQALLWKFGISSRIRENRPSYYKDTPEKMKIAYLLTIQTREGLRVFLDEIGALGKTDDLKLPNLVENNNRHTIPIEVNDLIRTIKKTRKKGKLYGEGSLRAIRGNDNGRFTLKYAPTYQKLADLVQYFRNDDHYDQRLVDTLESYLKQDVTWDTIEEIEYVGETECIDFEVDTYHSFIANGIVTHNSTLLGNSILSRMCIIPHCRMLYVSPSHEQTKVFRRDRVGETVALSDVFQAYISPKHANNMAVLKLVNYSQLTLRYAFLNADRCRGLTADAVYIDEIQDILTDNIPVIEECASHGNPDIKMFTYAGTPKSYDNTINYIWEKHSTQNEWAIPCTCQTTFLMGEKDAKKSKKQYFWNVPLNESHMGLHSLICAKCGKQIYSQSPLSHWVSMNPYVRKQAALDPFESFRVPQLMVPWIKWSDLLNKRETYSRARFHNEVLALPYDSGNRPLRIGDLTRNSVSPLNMHSLRDLYDGSRNVPLFFGIDWGGDSERSYTVLTMGAYLGNEETRGKLSIFYFKRFTGAELDPEVQITNIIQLIDTFQPLIIGVDYGGGFDRNSKLINRYGIHRIMRYQYIGGKRAGSGSKRHKIQYDTKKGRFLIERTEVMSDAFIAIKEDKLCFPKWEEWAEPFGKDFLSIYSEYDEITKTIQYDKSANSTDDGFHSMLYCLLASMVRFPRPDIIRPTQSTSGAALPAASSHFLDLG